MSGARRINGYPPGLVRLISQTIGLILVAFGLIALAVAPWYAKGTGLPLVLLGLLIFQRPTEVVRLIERWLPPKNGPDP